jgi:hypothetical protein
MRKHDVVIGVIAKRDDEEIVREFFELFKTPWEYYRGDEYYEAVLSSGDYCGDFRAPLTVVYGSDERSLDSILGRQLPSSGPLELNRNGVSFPIYYKAATFECGREAIIELGTSKRAAAVGIDRDRRRIVRMGYDLFEEVAFLLSSRQPPEYAHIPTLEIHISIVRDLMVEAGVPFIEIPPVPHGYDFIACLTHDIDFVGIRHHKFDQTMFGFLYRALWQTSLDGLRGRVPLEKLWKNLKAVALLPAVHLGIAADFWKQCRRYPEVETGLKSTFFFLPYKGKAGHGPDGPAPKKRACDYDLCDMREEVAQITSHGCEIGLHGIDAWLDLEEARKELDRISSVAGGSIRGARMHWLYFDSHSPQVLEKAGLTYDSSCGYNDAVGFAAGTAQVFRPMGATEFFELPLLIQDTALFYPRRMDLSNDKAFALCKKLIEDVSTFGGALVINWHDRSLAPERLWEPFYLELLDEIKSRRVWFGTGSEVTQWFKRRRSVAFSEVGGHRRIVRAKLDRSAQPSGADLSLKVYFPCQESGAPPTPCDEYAELAIHGDCEIEIPTKRACEHQSW